MATFRHRPIINTIPAYSQGKKPDSLPGLTPFKLSSNESPYQPLPSVQEALSRGPLESINRYPDMRGRVVCQRLAAQYEEDQLARTGTGLGLTEDNFLLGAGSTEVITQLVRMVAGPGDQVIYPWRSFEAYPIMVSSAGADSVQIPLTSDGRHNIDAMIAAVNDRTRLVIVNNPNNPTSTSVSRQEAQRVLAAVPEDILVLFDEAYFQFNSDPDQARGLDFFADHPNLVIAHTFSKAYGLAGLRIGYAIAHPDVVESLLKVMLPFGVSDMAQTGALASLEARPELGRRVQALIGERARVMEALKEQGWDAIPEPQANFFWLPLGEGTEDAAAAFARQALAVRAFPGEGIRVSLGLPEANDRMLSVCRNLRSL